MIMKLRIIILCVRKDDSTMNAFAEALSMASREGATFSQCHLRRSSDGSVFDQMDQNDGDGQTDKKEEYNEEMKQDDENVLPIDLSIATVTPPGEKNSSVSFQMTCLQRIIQIRFPQVS